MLYNSNYFLLNTAIFLSLIIYSGENFAAKNIDLTCKADYKHISHSLTISVNSDRIIRYAYRSIDRQNGHSCEIAAGESETLPIGRIDWQYWPMAITTQFLGRTVGADSIPMRVLLVKIHDGYQLSLQPDARANYCGTSGYIASTATLIKNKKDCFLAD